MKEDKSRKSSNDKAKSSDGKDSVSSPDQSELPEDKDSVPAPNVTDSPDDKDSVSTSNLNDLPEHQDAVLTPDLTDLPDDSEASQTNMKPSSPGILLINLHKYQRTFLLDTAKKSEIPVSELCELIIDAASGVEGAEDLLNQRVSPVVLSKKDLEKQRWRGVEIELNPDKLEKLEKLAVSQDQSASRILRYLIENYIRSTLRSANWYQKTQLSTRASSAIGRHRWKLGALAGFVIFIAGFGLYLRGNGPTLESPEWAGYLSSIVLDSRTHSTFSNGALSPKELVDLAMANGCEAMAITDHSDYNGGADLEQLEQMRRLRVLHPNLLLFSGIQVSIPRHQEKENLGILAGPDNENFILSRLADIAGKSIADSSDKDPSYQQLIQLLQGSEENADPLITIYNHASRKSFNVNETLEDILKWNRDGFLVTALEGAPGHLNSSQAYGSSSEPDNTLHRWDPIVAKVGGGWDTLLSQGHNIWGAIAPSDYYNEGLDKAPCEFSRTHISVPEKSYKGVLQALKAGTFWAEHGRILNKFKFSVEVEDMDEPAFPGAIVRIGHRNSTGMFNIAIERGPGSEELPLIAEIIGNCQSGTAETMKEIAISPGNKLVKGLLPIAEVGLDQKSCYIRARIRLVNWTADDYLAYSNPIRFIL